MHAVVIDSHAGPLPVPLDSGTVTLIVGPNGVGKSALLQDIYRRLPTDQVSYYPGHRQITFSHGWENLQMSLTDLDNNLFAQTEGFNRYKSVWPEEQFKSVLRRLQHAEAAYNQELISRLDPTGDNSSVLSRRESPVQLLNTIFQTARMAVSFKLTDIGLTAVRGGAEYQVDRLSDGERAALFVATAIVNRRAGGVVIIDEPERHLHPSISAPLISSAVRARPNLSFVFASHDLNLIETLQVDNFIYVRDSSLISINPERRIYDFRHVSALEDVSPDLKRDILGARDKVMFVEGEATSLDTPLYSNCFPAWKVAARGGHEKVQESVRALNDNSELHWMEVVGIVDGDGRTQEEIDTLKTAKIITLPVPTIENLFFLPEVVQNVVDVIVALEGGDRVAMYTAAEGAVSQVVQRNKDEIINRRTTWLANRKLAEGKVSVRDVREGVSAIPAVDIAGIRTAVEQELDEFVSTSPSLDTLRRLPIKNTGIPASIAQAIGLTIKRYKQIVLRQLEINSVEGQGIRTAILREMPVLP